MPNGITFNDLHSSDVAGGVGVLVYGFPVIPEMENKILDIATRSVDGGSFDKARPFTLEFLFKGDSIEEYFQRQFEIERWLNTGYSARLIFDAMPDRYLYCRPTAKAEPERSGAWAKMSVEFTAHDPHFYAIEETAHALDTTVTYDYEANKKTLPTFDITVDADASFFKITNQYTAGSMVLNRSVVIGDTITIDAKNRLIRLNGSDVRADLDVASRWSKMYIEPNYYKFTTNTASTIDISYIERW